VFDFPNAYHQEQKTYIKHSSGLHPGETLYLIVSLLHFHASIELYIFLTLSFSVYISLACESIPSGEERGETDAFAG